MNYIVETGAILAKHPRMCGLLLMLFLIAVGGILGTMLALNMVVSSVDEKINQAVNENKLIPYNGEFYSVERVNKTYGFQEKNLTFCKGVEYGI